MYIRQPCARFTLHQRVESLLEMAWEEMVVGKKKKKEEA